TLAGGLAGQTIQKPRDRLGNQEIVRIERKDAGPVVRLNHTLINPGRDVDLDQVDLVLSGTGYNLVASDQGEALRFAPLAAIKVGYLDARGLQPIKRALQFRILLTTHAPTTEFQDLSGRRAIGGHRQARPTSLAFADAVAPQLLGKMGNHVEEDVVIIGRSQADLGAALHRDDGVVEFIAQDPVASHFA